MKKTILVVLLSTLIFSSASMPKSLNYKVSTRIVFHSMVSLQMIVKGYLNHTLDQHILFDQRMGTAMHTLENSIQKLAFLKSDNLKVQLCLNILPICVDELKTLIQDKHTSENEQIILDLATVITNAIMGIMKGADEEVLVYKEDSKILRPALSAL